MKRLNCGVPAHKRTDRTPHTRAHAHVAHTQHTHVSKMPTHVSKMPTHVSKMPTHVSKMHTHVSKMHTHVSKMPTHVSKMPTQVRLASSVAVRTNCRHWWVSEHVI